jgi:hypothetical protein
MPRYRHTTAQLRHWKQAQVELLCVTWRIMKKEIIALYCDFWNFLTPVGRICVYPFYFIVVSAIVIVFLPYMLIHNVLWFVALGISKLFEKYCERIQ